MPKLKVMPKNPWARADAVSDEIVNIFRRHLLRVEFSPTQFLAGYFLAFKAMERSMPDWDERPETLQQVCHAINDCLRDMLEIEEHNRL